MDTQRSLMSYILLALKGMLMGAADVVPGVSGGTVAFMTGIYEELIASLRRCGPQALVVLFKQGPVAAWRYVNGTFLAVLVSGILLSIALIARTVLYFLETYPVHLWALFFGLILASSLVILKMIPNWNRNIVSTAILGAVIAYAVTSMVPVSVEVSQMTIFAGGMIAICAMILPGISGSFILLLMGLYGPVLAAVKGFEVVTLSIFLLGCVVGLLSFSRLLHWMFNHYHNITLALLAGFMFGSLNKVWPWKYTTAYTIDRHGREVALVQENVWPSGYEALSGDPSFAAAAFGLMAVGGLLVLLLEWRSRSG